MVDATAPKDPNTGEILKRSVYDSALNKSVYTGDPYVNKTDGSEVAIIEGLSSENNLDKIYNKLKGMRFDYNKGWVQFREPIMNAEGIGNIMGALQALSDNVNYSNFDEKEIPKLAFAFFKMNYPHYTIYHEQFGLNRRDFNIIKDILLYYPLSILKNAKNAGHRNVVRGTLSESVFMRAMNSGGEGGGQAEGGGFARYMRGLFRPRRRRL